jgi:hypothetical protein
MPRILNVAAPALDAATLKCYFVHTREPQSLSFRNTPPRLRNP